MQPPLSTPDDQEIHFDTFREPVHSVTRLVPASDVLLREADHRISNSLQFVSTFLALEERRLEDVAAKQVLAGVRRRITIVARLHRQLSTTTAPGQVALDDYLQTLSDDLSRAFIDGRRVTLLINVDRIIVSAEIARGLGLIVNELVSNALKHAFPEDQEGVIEVGCGLDANGQISLHVSDNGVGHPGGVGRDNSGGLGMKMVAMLLQQMKARCDTAKSGNGLIHRISLSRE